MKQASLFFTSLKKAASWKTIFLTIVFFYFFGIALLRLDTIFSLFSNLGILDGVLPVLSLFFNPLDTFSLFNLIIFLFTATLFAFNIVALRLYTQKRFSSKDHRLSLFGIIGALVGCLACCGSIVVVASASLIGVSLSTLPFAGQEIALFGLLVSFFALIYTIRKIDAPLVC